MSRTAAALAASTPGADAGTDAGMAEYAWRGVDARGESVHGTTRARSERLLRADLLRRGIRVQRISLHRPERAPRWQRAVSGRELAAFSRQWVTLLSAGIPLLDALELIASASPQRRLRGMLTDIARAIAHGAPVHEALARWPDTFDRLYRNLVHVGESTGTLDTVLTRLASEREARERLITRVRRALYYPAVVLLVAALVCGVLLVVVVPQFEQTFRGVGAELPAFTRAIIASSRFVAGWWWALTGGALLAVLALVLAWRRSATLRWRCDAWRLRLPLLGTVFHKAATARFARVLATTVQAGVPLLDALEMVAGASGNRVLDAAARRMRQAIAAGGTLHEAMARSGWFAPLPVQMVAIGEEAGALDGMLHQVADLYAEDVNGAVDTLGTLLEPVIMLLIGGVVGALVIGMYLPVFHLAPNL